MSLVAEIRSLAADTLAVMRHPDARGAVVTYAGLAAVFFAYGLWTSGLLWTLGAILLGIVLLPVVEFVTHKYVLHLLELARTRRLPRSGIGCTTPITWIRRIPASSSPIRRALSCW